MPAFRTSQSNQAVALRGIVLEPLLAGVSVEVTGVTGTVTGGVEGAEGCWRDLSSKADCSLFFVGVEGVETTGVEGTSAGGVVTVPVLPDTTGTADRSGRGGWSRYCRRPGIERRSPGDVELAEAQPGDRVVDRVGPFLQPVGHLGHRGQDAEPMLVDLLEQHDGPADQGCGEAGAVDAGIAAGA